MWNFVSSISLIRYLIVWRANRSLVQLPRCLSTALSLTLGTIIAERLPTQQARDWRKALAAWDSPAVAGASGPLPPPAPARAPVPAKARRGRETEEPLTLQGPFPETGWPIQSVLLPYPGKRAYGPGELILWELKLLGADADHGLFLETILPAMEAAATTSDPRWHRSRSLWGGFDIQAVYVARGPRWEPLVREGRLDLNCRPTPAQWAEGLPAFADDPRTGETPKRPWRQVTWITPFDLNPTNAGDSAPQAVPRATPPSLEDIFKALMARLPAFLPGKRPTIEQAWALLSPEEIAALALDVAQAELAHAGQQALTAPPKDWPGRWIGAQAFSRIPPRLLPYLELAAILHIGRQTHFGCGTFALAAASPARRG